MRIPLLFVLAPALDGSMPLDPVAGGADRDAM